MRTILGNLGVVLGSRLKLYSHYTFLFVEPPRTPSLGHLLDDHPNQFPGLRFSLGSLLSLLSLLSFGHHLRFQRALTRLRNLRKNRTTFSLLYIPSHSDTSGTARLCTNTRQNCADVDILLFKFRQCFAGPFENDAFTRKTQQNVFCPNKDAYLYL